MSTPTATTPIPPSKPRPSLNLTILNPPGPEVPNKILSAYQSTSSTLLSLYAHPNPNIHLFLDALAVRYPVFVTEQKTPLVEEIDTDDGRSWHFTAYDEATNNPVSTLRIVPEPHATHPLPGSRDFVGGELPDGQVREEGARDVRTKMHDGREAYVKIGRVATLKEWRGKGVAGWLMRKALEWAMENWDVLSSSAGGEEGKWKGLMMVHAQDWVVPIYRRYGFEIDEELGVWYEIDIPHVGMWMRLEK